MAVDTGFSLDELEDLNTVLRNLANKQFPNEVKKFLRRQATVTKKKLRENTKAATKRKTGNLLKGINNTPPKKYKGDYQIRVYNGANHAHLIEHGHSNIKTKPSRGSQGKIPIGSPVQMVPGNGEPLFVSGREIWVPGKHVAAKTVVQMKEIFAENADNFIDELLDKGLG